MIFITQSQFFTLIKTSGIPFKYHHWERPPQLPYGVYLITGSSNFMADGQVYQKTNNISVEIYTEKKDPATEMALENVLDGAGIFYDKIETYIDSEKMFQISYEMEI